MPERIHAYAGNQIEVALAVEVVDPAASSAVNDERVAGVVLKKIFPLEFDDLLRSGGCFGFAQRFHLSIIQAPPRRLRRCGVDEPLSTASSSAHTTTLEYPVADAKRSPPAVLIIGV